MERQSKINAILDAVRHGKASKRQIDVRGKGKAVKKLESGHVVPDEKLDEMYGFLEIALGKTGNELVKKPMLDKKSGVRLGNNSSHSDNFPEIVRQKLDNLEKENTSLKSRVAFLVDKIVDIETRLGSLIELDRKLDIPLPDVQKKSDKKAEQLAKNVLGFTVTEKEMKGGKKYWYGAKNDNGKTLWAYIGKDRSLAEEKLRAWLLKHRPDLLQE